MNIKSELYQLKNRIVLHDKPKIFGIGNNKTGTTSLKTAMKDLGFVVGDQTRAEMLMEDWSKRNFKKLISYCKEAQFFQDIPFSKPYTFIAMDQAFPNSKFILTVRDSPEQWYNSLVNFHARLWGKGGRIPTKEDLQEAFYLGEGRPWQANRWSYTTPEDNPYEKKELIESYIRHNEVVKDYFRHRPHNLLVLNVAEKGGYKKLTEFLGLKSQREDFPWENKTSEINKQ